MEQIYLDKAAECFAVAKLTPDPAEQGHLLEVAQCYLRLAKHVASRQPRPEPKSAATSS
jgi:hypothetical protein